MKKRKLNVIMSFGTDTTNLIKYFRINSAQFYWLMRVPDRGPEQRESNLTVLCPLIIIILISYIILYYDKIINYGEPSQPKPETELPHTVLLT
jgi:hypothetical protein